MHREGVKISFIGDLSVLPRSLYRQMERSMQETRNNQAIQFNVAINYGGRDELLHACRQLMAQARQGHLAPEDVNADLFAQHLYTANAADPDLLIRTSGEMRLSNYLLWQMAYTELYFTDVLFPDFDRAAFHHALLDYQNRDRRFGQVTSKN
jgi:undecaprenyl diphosphate synthase